MSSSPSFFPTLIFQIHIYVIPSNDFFWPTNLVMFWTKSWFLIFNFFFSSINWTKLSNFLWNFLPNFYITKLKNKNPLLPTRDLFCNFEESKTWAFSTTTLEQISFSTKSLFTFYFYMHLGIIAILFQLFFFTYLSTTKFEKKIKVTKLANFSTKRRISWN